MRAIRNTLFLLALLFSLSSCEVTLSEVVVTPLLNYAVVEIAKPIVDPVIKAILATLGVSKAQAAEADTTLIVQRGIENEWRNAHKGRLGYTCPSGTDRSVCVEEARSAANVMARNHGEAFNSAYRGCNREVIGAGRGDWVQSIREVNQCTAASGFSTEMALIVQAAGAN